MLDAVLGGALIGLAASIALVAGGRIAGVSGTLGRLARADGGLAFRLPFVLGLLVVGIATQTIAPARLGAPVTEPIGMAIAGLLVGVGTAIANGCTSGHGVCGIARLSPRSLVAVATFMTTAAITVAIARHA
jgi:uncharacterized membrane protein YedE/YeeE